MTKSQPFHGGLVVSAIAFAAIFTVLTVHDASGAGAGLPDGWILSGSAPLDFETGTDQSIVHGGKTSAYLKSKAAKPAGFGTLMQMCKAEPFLGKRVRMSAWAKSENVMGWAGLWLRVDGSDPNRSLAFDNMQSRPIKGTSGWSQCQIVLDVAPDAKDIAFGILLDGQGGVWLDDINFEIVDLSVPTTGMRASVDLPAKPKNLDFER